MYHTYLGSHEFVAGFEVTHMLLNIESDSDK